MTGIARLAMPVLFLVTGAIATIASQGSMQIVGILVTIAGIAILVLELRRRPGVEPSDVLPADIERSRDQARSDGIVTAVKDLRRRYPGLSLIDAHQIVTG